MISRHRSVVFTRISAAAALVVVAADFVASLAYSIGRYVHDYLAQLSLPQGVLSKTHAHAQAQAELPGEKSRVMAMEAGWVEMCRKHGRWTACPST